MIAFFLFMCASFAVAMLQLVHFLKIYTSQGSVATRFGCGEIFNDILKIDQYLALIWTKVGGTFFMDHGVVANCQLILRRT